MEYNPKYPQPFSLSQAIALDPAVARDEIARLKNSLVHLKRSQGELQEYLRDLAQEEDLEVGQAVRENEMTIASQDERIFMLKLALAHHGQSVVLEQTPTPPKAAHSQNTIGSSSNGLDDLHLTGPTVNVEIQETEEQENGVYL